MTRKIVKDISELTGVRNDDVIAVLESLSDLITLRLHQAGKLTVPSLGVFTVTSHKKKFLKNDRSGTEIRKVTRFSWRPNVNIKEGVELLIKSDEESDDISS